MGLCACPRSLLSCGMRPESCSAQTHPAQESATHRAGEATHVGPKAKLGKGVQGEIHSPKRTVATFKVGANMVDRNQGSLTGAGVPLARKKIQALPQGVVVDAQGA